MLCSQYNIEAVIDTVFVANDEPKKASDQALMLLNQRV